MQPWPPTFLQPPPRAPLDRNNQLVIENTENVTGKVGSENTLLLVLWSSMKTRLLLLSSRVHSRAKITTVLCSGNTPMAPRRRSGVEPEIPRFDVVSIWK